MEHEAQFVHWKVGDMQTIRLKEAAGLDHRVVFDRRGYDVISSCRKERMWSTDDGQIVGLGPASW